MPKNVESLPNMLELSIEVENVSRGAEDIGVNGCLPAAGGLVL